MRTAAIVGVMFVMSVPVFAQQKAPAPQVTARFGALRSEQQKDPYGNLFKAQEELKKALAQAQLAMPKSMMPKSKIVCGMLIIPADPKVDPKIAIPPNKTPNLEYKIRVMEPPICNPAK